MIDCAHMVACKSVFVFVYFSVNSCMCVWFVRPVCTRDICMYTCAYLGLLYELVLSVCECGRGRPSACQYVLMLHIWFPNFLPSLPALPSAPLHHDVRTLFCFFWVVMVVVEGGGCLMSDGPEYRTSTVSLSLPLSLPLLFSIFLLFNLFLISYNLY